MCQDVPSAPTSYLCLYLPSWQRSSDNADNVCYSKRQKVETHQWPFQAPKLEVPTIYKAYIGPEFQAKISGDIPTKYGQKYGTNLPPFWDPEIQI